MIRYRGVLVFLALMINLLLGCSVTINKSNVEMSVRQGSRYLPNGTGYFDFGNVPLNTTTPSISFTIDNRGMGDLILTNSPPIELTGSQASEFVSDTSMILTVIQSHMSTDFTITFKPTSYGIKTATISIASNDSARNPYTFLVTGKATTPAPEIHVMQDQTDILSPSGIYDFGYVPVHSKSKFVTFTIYNLGNKELILTGTQDKIEKTGANSSMFVIDQTSIDNLIPIKGETSFSISYQPTINGELSATILIKSNDNDENPYVFTVKGGGYDVAEMNVKQGAVDIESGTGVYDFGGIEVGKSSTNIAFTIENIGTSYLVLSGTPDPIEISGTDASMFAVNQNQITNYIYPGNKTSFSIIFTPTSEGEKSATITIVNNDPNENPYTFTIKGSGTIPEINVKQGSINIPSSTGTFNMGYSIVNSSGPEIEFTIENVGTATLKLTGTPIVELLGTNANQFNLNTSQTKSSIDKNNSTTFKISFKPTSLGLKTATISIENNDSDENPYTFTITGFCSNYIEGDVNGDSYPDVIIGAASDDDGGSNSGCAFIFFGKHNWNSTIDASNADVKLIGEDSNDRFGMSVSYAGDINNDGIGDVIVGAYYDDENGVQAGTVFIFFGRKNWDSSIDASNADVKLVGLKSGDCFGYVVSKAGDVNNDKIDDIIIGAYGVDDGGSSAGAAYIFFGRSNWSSKISASNANVKLVGEDMSDYFGVSATEAGDVNNDGIDDVIVGGYLAKGNGTASGGVYIFFGRTNWPSSIDGANASVRIYGEAPGDYLGYCVSRAGDVNKDNIDDIIISAHAGDYGGTYSGCAYIFFGKSNWGSTINANTANVKLIGEDSNDYFGRSVSYTGDVNKDGIDDIVIGAYYDDDGGTNSGCAFVFYGRTNWSSSIDASNADIKLIGENEGDLFGYPVGTYGDVNGDGYSDIIVSAKYDDDGGTYSGCSFIFMGKNNLGSSIDASQADVKLVGGDSNDTFGSMK